CGRQLPGGRSRRGAGLCPLLRRAARERRGETAGHRLPPAATWSFEGSHRPSSGRRARGRAGQAEPPAAANRARVRPLRRPAVRRARLLNSAFGGGGHAMGKRGAMWVAAVVALVALVAGTAWLLLPPRTGVVVIDVSDPAGTKFQGSCEVDGNHR